MTCSMDLKGKFELRVNLLADFKRLLVVIQRNQIKCIKYLKGIK